MNATEKQVDIVLPCYRPPENWVTTVSEAHQQLSQLLPNYDLRFIIVNDGDPEVKTQDVSILKESIVDLQYIELDQNGGKGAAVREGMKVSQAPVAIFTDIEFPYEYDDVVRVIKCITDQEHDVALGQRKANKKTKPSLTRWVVSTLLRFLNGFFFGRSVADTQCGLKGFNLKGKQTLLSTKTRGYLFDIELVLRAKSDDKLSITGIPVHLSNRVDFSELKPRKLVREAFHFGRLLGQYPSAHRGGGLAAFFLPLLFLSVFYTNMVFSPNSYVFTLKGDGIKNYYTYAHHIKSDDNWLEFEGMNYPFKEHLVYTDAQPLLANVLRSRGQLFPWIENYSIGILNLLILLSFAWCSYCLYLIFKRLRIKGYYAIFSACAIALLSPHTFRIPWHHALSYACIIPLAILLFFRFYEKRTIWRSGLIGLMVLAASFLHPYWALILATLFGTFWVGLLMQERLGLLKKLANYLHFFTQTVLPIVLFSLILSATDTHTGRIGSPEHFFDFTASLDNTFASPYPPFGDTISSIFSIDKEHQILHWEGRSYIGLMSILILVLSLFFIKKIAKAIAQIPYAGLLLSVGLLSYLAAMAFPFITWPELADLMPSIKQFRALGRLAWITYFSITVLAAYFLFTLCQPLLQSKRKAIGLGLLALFPILNIWESTSHHSESALFGKDGYNLFSPEICKTQRPQLYNAIKQINPVDFQAIVPIPYFHIGSESFGRPYVSFSYVVNPFTLSYHTGLPLTSVFASRTSVDETRLSMQFFSPIKQEKPILDKFIADKPLLVFQDLGEPLPPDESWILEYAKPVYRNDKFSLLAILPKDIATFSVKQPECGSIVYSSGFEETKTALAFSGNGALELPHKGINALMDHTAFDQKENAAYRVSFWFENSENRCQSKLNIGVLENGEMTCLETFPKVANTYETLGSWSKYRFLISDKIARSAFVVYFEGHDSKQRIYIDDLEVCEVPGS